MYVEMPADSSKPMNLRIAYNQFPFNIKTPCTLSTPEMKSPFDLKSFTSQEKINVLVFVLFE